MVDNILRRVRLRYTEKILAEACWHFGFEPDKLEQLEGSAFVYEGELNGKPRILKISPALLNPQQHLLGATLEQILGELDFVRFLAENGVPVALPIASRAGNLVESMPLDHETGFLACAFEKAPGFMYADDPVVEFPETVLVEWGRLMGSIHRLSEKYHPSNPAWARPTWEADDLLDFRSLIPADQPLVWQRFEEMIATLHNLPRDPTIFGLIHGDLHHGNFFNDNGRLIVFDFDASHYFWYTGDIVIALYNCLPIPRSETDLRRNFALHFLSHFLQGYRLEKTPHPAINTLIPLFLKLNELLDYAHKYKFWDMSKSTDRHRTILADMRHRIEQEIAVVKFQPGDLEN